MPFILPPTKSKKSKKSKSAKRSKRGVCRECGCTDAEACLGGCSWTDGSQTLCTACVPAAAAGPSIPFFELDLLTTNISSKVDQLHRDITTLTCHGDKLDFVSIMLFRELRSQMDELKETVQTLQQKVDGAQNGKPGPSTRGIRDAT